MTCQLDPNGVHRFGQGATHCSRCGDAVPEKLVESREQPSRETIRAQTGAGAYGKTAVDVARRRAGDGPA